MVSLRSSKTNANIQMIWEAVTQKARSFLLKEHLNGRHYYLPEKKGRNIGYLETWNTGVGGYNTQDWHYIMRYILHNVWLAYFVTKTWTLPN